MHPFFEFEAERATDCAARAKWIVNKCFKGDLVTGRTVLLVVCLTFSPFPARR